MPSTTQNRLSSSYAKATADRSRSPFHNAIGLRAISEIHCPSGHLPVNDEEPFLFKMNACDLLGAACGSECLVLCLVVVEPAIEDVDDFARAFDYADDFITNL